MTRQTLSLMLAGMIFMGVVYAIPAQQAFAHTFSGDESASFLTLIEATKVQLQLTQSDFGSNMEEAHEHAEHAAEGLDEDIIEEISEKNERLGRDLPAALDDLNESLSNSTKPEIDSKIQNINDLLAETVTVRVEQDQLSNSTMQALVLANMADEVLGHYGGAYGIEEQEHEESNETHDEADEMESNSTNGSSVEMGQNASDTIVDMAQYHSAQAMAAKLQQYYNEEVEALAPSNATEALLALESGLEKLKQAIDNEEPLEDVQVIVHTEVQPNLQKAYNLELAGQTDTPDEFMEEVTLDGNTYRVTGRSSSVNVTAVRIDSGQAVGVDFEGSGEVELTLPKTMIEGINMRRTTEGQTVNYTLNETESTTTIIFTVEEGVSSVDIMGAMVVPEFPVIGALLAATIVGIIGYTRFARSGAKEFFRNH